MTPVIKRQQDDITTCFTFFYDEIVLSILLYDGRCYLDAGNNEEAEDWLPILKRDFPSAVRPEGPEDAPFLGKEITISSFDLALMKMLAES